MNEREQENAWHSGWRPAGYRDRTEDERTFAALHPGWKQAAWAHPKFQEWCEARAKSEQAGAGWTDLGETR